MNLHPHTPNIQQLQSSTLSGMHLYPPIYVRKENHKTDQPLPVDFSCHPDDFPRVTPYSKTSHKKPTW